MATEIKSLQDYLNYFNPDYRIINDTLKAEVNGKIINIEPDEDKTLYNSIKRKYQLKSQGSVVEEEGYIIFPGYLSYRQGFYNDENSNVYISYSKPTTEEEVIELTSKDDLIPFTPSTTIISNK